MKVQVFAVMKDYFDENFEMVENVKTIDELVEKLILINPEAKNLIATCRFAVNNEFIDENFILSGHDIIYIVPPSSGG